MKKKVFSLLAVVLFMGSSFGNSSTVKEDVITSDCSLFAYYAGSFAKIYGGNYYQAYFAAYNHCLNNIDPI